MSKKEQGIEELLASLGASLDKISSDDIRIEDSIKEYAKAAVLIEQCHEKLAQAKVQVLEIDERLQALEADDGV